MKDRNHGFAAWDLRPSGETTNFYSLSYMSHTRTLHGRAKPVPPTRRFCKSGRVFFRHGTCLISWVEVFGPGNATWAQLAWRPIHKAQEQIELPTSACVWQLSRVCLWISVSFLSLQVSVLLLPLLNQDACDHVQSPALSFRIPLLVFFCCVHIPDDSCAAKRGCSWLGQYWSTGSLVKREPS